MQEVVEKGSIQQMEFLPEELRSVFVTAMDIEPQWHLKMQAAFQKYTDNAVSKTVNLPNSATQEDIYKIYWMAYEEGYKGVTVAFSVMHSLHGVIEAFTIDWQLPLTNTLSSGTLIPIIRFSSMFTTAATPSPPPWSRSPLPTSGIRFGCSPGGGRSPSPSAT